MKTKTLTTLCSAILPAVILLTAIAGCQTSPSVPEEAVTLASSTAPAEPTQAPPANPTSAPTLAPPPPTSAPASPTSAPATQLPTQPSATPTTAASATPPASLSAETQPVDLAIMPVEGQWVGSATNLVISFRITHEYGLAVDE